MTHGESFLFYDNFSVYEEIYILINVIFDQDSNKCDQLFLTVEIRTSYEIWMFLDVELKKKVERVTKT